MSEKQEEKNVEKTEENTETKTDADATKETGDKDIHLSPIEKAEATLKKIEEVEKRVAELVVRQENAAARMMVGGRAEAGSDLAPEKVEEAKLEEQVKENIKKYMD